MHPSLGLQGILACVIHHPRRGTHPASLDQQLSLSHVALATRPPLDTEGSIRYKASSDPTPRVPGYSKASMRGMVVINIAANGFIPY